MSIDPIQAHLAMTQQQATHQPAAPADAAAAERRCEAIAHAESAPLCVATAMPLAVSDIPPVKRSPGRPKKSAE